MPTPIMSISCCGEVASPVLKFASSLLTKMFKFQTIRSPLFKIDGEEMQANV